jgi:hypothetical protein
LNLFHPLAYTPGVLEKFLAMSKELRSTQGKERRAEKL